MPIRMLYPGILSSTRVNALSCEAELFYRRLMSVVDDYGRFEADPRLLVSSCYPLTFDRISPSFVSKVLLECSQSGEDGSESLITLYSVGSKNYLQINNFKQRTRTDSKFPSPPLLSNDSKCQQMNAYARASSSSSDTTTHTTANGTEGLYQRYELWMQCWPEADRRGVDEGARAWITLVDAGTITEQNVGEVFAGMERWKTSELWANGYIPNIARWLIEKRWKDSPKPKEDKNAW